MRILVLSSSTGGGHDMRARSIVSWAGQLSTVDDVIEVRRYQALESSSAVYGLGVGIYNWIQKFCPRLHHLYFNWLEIFQVSLHERLLLGKRRFERVLREAQPDVIISVHAHTNHAFRVIAKRMLPAVKFVTYCGEMSGGYGFSRHWVDPQADAFIGATREICDEAMALKMPVERTRHGGFLLNPHFYGNAAEMGGSLRQGLGLSEDRFTLLLSTGANGAQNHADFLDALDRAGLSLQVIALCGRNVAAQQALLEWESRSGGIAVRVLGFREDMFELMAGCDAMVARPGTGTTSEAIMAGCPILLNTLGGVMPQEWITVKYLRAQGLDAVRIKRASDLATQLGALIENEGELDRMRRKMTELRPSCQPEEIFEYLAELRLQG